MSITLTLYGTLVITRSSMLLPPLGFLLSFLLFFFFILIVLIIFTIPTILSYNLNNLQYL